MTRSWRWLVVAGGVAVLVALPAVVQAWPVDAPAVPAAELAARARASVSQPYQGFVRTSGALTLPDLGVVADDASLLTGSSKLRVWFDGPTAWRVDRIDTTGERDMYGDAGGTWMWDSLRRSVQRIDTAGELRLPRPADLVPPELGRRLLDAAAPAELQPLAPARVAGRAVPGVRVVPSGAVTTIDHADIWVDARTGVPVEVQITAKGERHPSLESSFLELSFTAPNPSLVRFDTAVTAQARRRSGLGDPVAALSRFTPISLPASIAGLERRSTAGPVASYGTGFGIVDVVAVPSFFADRVVPDAVPSTTRPWGGQAQVVSTPLLNAMFIDTPRSGYAVVGPVTVDELDRVSAALTAAARSGS